MSQRSEYFRCTNPDCRFVDYWFCDEDGAKRKEPHPHCPRCGSKLEDAK